MLVSHPFSLWLSRLTALRDLVLSWKQRLTGRGSARTIRREGPSLGFATRATLGFEPLEDRIYPGDALGGLVLSAFGFPTAPPQADVALLGVAAGPGALTPDLGTTGPTADSGGTPATSDPPPASFTAAFPDPAAQAQLAALTTQATSPVAALPSAATDTAPPSATADLDTVFADLNGLFPDPWSNLPGTGSAGGGGGGEATAPAASSSGAGASVSPGAAPSTGDASASSLSAPLSSSLASEINTLTSLVSLLGTGTVPAANTAPQATLVPGTTTSNAAPLTTNALAPAPTPPPDPGTTPPPNPGTTPPPPSPTQLVDQILNSSQRFEPNVGQTDPSVQYLAQGPGYTVFLTSTEAVLALTPPAPTPDPNALPVTFPDPDALPASPAPPVTSDVIRLQLVGANPNAQAVGEHVVANQANYYLGSDPSQWHTGVDSYSQVSLQNVYPGVDAVYLGNSRQQLEYNYVVAPGVKPNVIQMQVSGAQQVQTDAQGNLQLTTPNGTLTLQAPTIYQDANGIAQPISGNYTALGNDTFGFQVGAYDPTQTLVIDPALVYSSFLGGNTYGASALAVDAAGNAYLTGYTSSPSFPTANAFQTTYGGNNDVFVTELAPTGAGPVFSTYVGGSNGDVATALALDPSGNLYVTGFTGSADFPTQNAYQASSGGSDDAFLAKFSPGGHLAASTYLGGLGYD